MTTVIKGIEQTIEHTINLGCHVIEWNDTVLRVQDASSRYQESLWGLHRAVFLCGLSGVISQRNVDRLQSMIDKGIDQIADRERARLLRL